jgi:hypothetical protein
MNQTVIFLPPSDRARAGDARPRPLTRARSPSARQIARRIAHPPQSVDYIVPTLTASLLSILARDFMWTRVLSSTPMLDKEAQDRLPERLRGIGAQVDKAAAFLAEKARDTQHVAENLAMERSSGGGGGGYGRAGFSMAMSRGGGGGGAGGTMPDKSPAGERGERVPPALVDAAVAADAVCGEMCRGFALQQLKDALFNLRAKRAAAAAAAAAAAPMSDEPAAPPASHA